jgi:hypothetical protein
MGTVTTNKSVCAHGSQANHRDGRQTDSSTSDQVETRLAVLKTAFIGFHHEDLKHRGRADGTRRLHENRPIQRLGLAAALRRSSNQISTAATPNPVNDEATRTFTTASTAMASTIPWYVPSSCAL